jgi:hypothetical protein
MLMERVSIWFFPFLLYCLCAGCGEYMPEQLDLDFWADMNERYPYFQHNKA